MVCPGYCEVALGSDFKVTVLSEFVMEEGELVAEVVDPGRQQVQNGEVKSVQICSLGHLQFNGDHHTSWHDSTVLFLHSRRKVLYLTAKMLTEEEEHPFTAWCGLDVSWYLPLDSLIQHSQPWFFP